MILDLPTVVALTALSAFLMGASILLSNRTQFTSDPSFNSFGVACLGQGLGWLLLGLHGHAPDALLIFGGSWVLVLSGLCALHSVRVWIENAPSPDWCAAVKRSLGTSLVLALLSGAALAYFSFVYPDVASRTMVTSLCHGFINGNCALRLLGPRPIPASRRVVAVGFGLVVALQVFRVAMLWIDPPRPAEIFAQMPSQTGTLLFGHVAVVMLTLLFVLMVHDRTARELRGLVTLDYLTGIFNRSAFEGYARQSIEQARRSGDALSLLLFDVDNFKGINDTLGHLTGDVALRTLTALTIENLRSQDVFGRYGGEEFAVLLPATDAEGAFLVAERIREAVANAEFRDEATPFRLTISIGIAQFSPSGENSIEQRLTELFRAADTALYDAKRAGRNRTLIAAPENNSGASTPRENP